MVSYPFSFRFLDDSEQQFNELVADVQMYETWAAEYGYKPRLGNVDDEKEKSEGDTAQEVCLRELSLSLKEKSRDIEQFPTFAV